MRCSQLPDHAPCCCIDNPRVAAPCTLGIPVCHRADDAVQQLESAMTREPLVGASSIDLNRLGCCNGEHLDAHLVRCEAVHVNEGLLCGDGLGASEKKYGDGAAPRVAERAWDGGVHGTSERTVQGVIAPASSASAP